MGNMHLQDCDIKLPMILFKRVAFKVQKHNFFSLIMVLKK